MSPEYAYPKSRFEPDSRSARLNAAPHRRAPAPIPSPPTLSDRLGPGDCARLHSYKGATARLGRSKNTQMRFSSSRAPPGRALWVEKVTPECERNHRAGARHPFQYYYRRFGVGFCVCSQTFLPGGLKSTGPQTVAEESFPGSGKWPERSGGRWGRHAATNPTSPSDFAAKFVGRQLFRS